MIGLRRGGLRPLFVFAVFFGAFAVFFFMASCYAPPRRASIEA
jgi:hypothetical protein